MYRFNQSDVVVIVVVVVVVALVVAVVILAQSFAHYMIDYLISNDFVLM